MSEFYLGFWWSFPALMVGVLMGWGLAKAKGEKSNDQFGMAVLVSWAVLGVLALFSGYPVLEALKAIK